MFFKKKETKKYPRHLRIYINSESENAILAPCNYRGGFISEVPGEAIKISCEDSSGLGAEFQSRMQHTTSDEVYLSNRGKLKDWPAFVASGLKTGKEFERKYTMYSICGLNSANLFYSVTSPKLPNDIELQLLINSCEIPLQIGIELKKIHQFYEKSRANT